ncbi:hypothetical protein KB681_gp28 [Burkholderia phage Mica]|uniref:Uncharacterized protein n=1 Tax=Burkholderia phage Mica TaxID=2767579 RepID=A0A873WLU2_9CAUD|nr:hypothetical protein KB681_gp28 [Burkholderia phage Mica]QPB08641.1 hypothetical protein CPT_Mica_028 [Burkholderia phage Mica]
MKPRDTLILWMTLRGDSRAGAPCGAPLVLSFKQNGC